MAQITSEGKCLFCSKLFKKAGITRHLNTHLVEKIKDNKPGKSFHVRIDPNPRWGSSPYFLNLWVDGNALMEHIDIFLRNIWLECCGHMSAFTNPAHRKQFGGAGMFDLFEAQELLMQGKMRAYENMMEETNGEVPKSKKVKDILYNGLKLEYKYDFGSTTDLLLTVAAEYPVRVDEPIVLLSRNEPLQMMCDVCHVHPANTICAICMGEEENLFCNTCAEKHAETCSDFADYARMPVVNSPRMGVCAYEGGTIDTERDGVFNKK